MQLDNNAEVYTFCNHMSLVWILCCIFLAVWMDFWSLSSFPGGGSSVCWPRSLKPPTVLKHKAQEDSFKITSSRRPGIIKVRQFMQSTILIHNARTGMQWWSHNRVCLSLSENYMQAESIFWLCERSFTCCTDTGL